MYNFRYHLVTIVSIFAALALGLLLGVALTGSDLVRDASSNLAQSLTQQFDELNKTNDQLSDQLQTEQLLNKTLLDNWQGQRLKGRTIVILASQEGAYAELTGHLRSLVVQSGGIAVVVHIDPEINTKLEDEALAAKLEALLPKVDGEEYSLTLARQLVEEWSFSTANTADTVPASFEHNYQLTKQMVASNLISISVDYGSLLALETNKTAALPPAVEWQMASYRQAQSQSLPYAANGVIDMAVHPPHPQSSQMILDPLALAITQQFDSFGQAGELPYLHAVVDVAFGSQDGGQDGSEAQDGAQPDGDAQPGTGNADSVNGTGSAAAAAEAPLDPDANYFALIAQQGGFDAVLLATARDTGLSCQISPLSSSGSYSIIALLTGAKKGSYGLDYSGVSPFPPIPADDEGNRVFARDKDQGTGTTSPSPTDNPPSSANNL